jgi:cytochrome c peroxidase
MATATRTFTRTAIHSSFRPTIASRGTVNHFARQSFRQQWQRRGYADPASPKTNGSSSGSSSSPIFWLLGLGAVGGGGYFFYNQNKELFGGEGQGTKVFEPKFEDYRNVYNAIAKSLQEHDEYEDGSYGPVVLRLAWHASGTYVETSTHFPFNSPR